MPKISAIKQQIKHRDRVSVFIDGEYAFGLQKILILGLSVGRELTAAEIDDLRRRDAAEVAYERALFYLSFRPRSESEIRGYLAKKEVDEGAVEQVIDRLIRAKLVDDLQFAQTWVENREALRPRGRWALRAELRQKGVDREIIERALEDVDEEEGAWRVAQKLQRRLASLDGPAFRRRLLGYLQRRGFGYDVAVSTANRLWGKIESGREAELE